MTDSMVERARFIEVDARVRYWEDAYVNGVEDTDGHIPLRKGDDWQPVIDLDTGCVQGWPDGTEADVHYKVCDAGLYWLLDADRNRIAKWDGAYVPSDILCVNDSGYGDYIIFKIGADGLILGWERPSLKKDEWSALEQRGLEG